MNCSKLICTSESGEATSTRAVASLIQKMSPPQLYKRRLVLINQLILATERSFGSIGQQDLIGVPLAKHHYPASGAQLISFWHVGAGS